VRFDDYKLVIYRNRPDGWGAAIPAIAGFHALLPTAEEAIGELAKVFQLIEEEHRTSGRELSRDSTEIVHAWCPRHRVPAGCRQARVREFAPNRKPPTVATQRRTGNDHPSSRPA
jgi:predicted RNase H-like HicB family nuclease